MSAPAFWAGRGPAAWALAPVGAVVGVVDAAKRLVTCPARFGVPVICVGNVTVGGTGKTPTVIALVERLIARGETPVVLTRGHGGRVRGPHLVDTTRDDAAGVGDEPLLIARHAPVVVDADRARGAAHALRLGASVLVMDDGMQNRGLAKDLVLSLVDGASGIGNGFVVPAGPLRGFLAVQARDVDAVVLVGDGDAGLDAARAQNRPIIRARLAPAPAALAFRGLPVFAFCGIGKPAKFRRTLDEIGARVVGFRAFPDHHPFTVAEVDALVAEGVRSGGSIVTTEKDHVRLLASPHGRAQLAGLAQPIGVATVFGDEAAIDGLIGTALARFRTGRPAAGAA